MPKFEWDANKNDSNKRKHGVSFERATETFDDPNGVTSVGRSGNELRFLRIGKTIGRVILAVIYTFRNSAVRIISARSARKKEIQSYSENSLSKQSREYDND